MAKKKRNSLTIPKNLTKDYLKKFITDVVTQCYETHTFFLGFMEANKKVFEKHEDLKLQAVGIDGTLTDIAESLKEITQNIGELPNIVNKETAGAFAMAELTLQTVILTLNSVSVSIIPDLYVQVMELCEKDPSLGIELPENAKQDLQKLIMAVSKKNELHKNLLTKAVSEINQGDENGK